MKINFDVKEKSCIVNNGDVLVGTDDKLVMVATDEINNLVRLVKLPEATIINGEYSSLTTLSIDISCGRTIFGLRIKEVIPADRLELSLV